MGRFNDVIEADAHRDADPAPTEDQPATDDGPGRDISPFSMNYEVDRYDLDAETTDRMLTVLVAVTNIL